MCLSIYPSVSSVLAGADGATAAGGNSMDARVASIA